MKTRVNLTIDRALWERMKIYAASRNTSVSKLVETYFKRVSRPDRRKNILQLIDQLESAIVDPKADLKELYYQDR